FAVERFGTPCFESTAAQLFSLDSLRAHYGIHTTRNEADRAPSETRPAVEMGALASSRDGHIIYRSLRYVWLCFSSVSFGVGSRPSRFSFYFIHLSFLDEVLFLFCIRRLVFRHRGRQVAR